MLTPASRERDFPSLTGQVYLNSAAEGIPPLAVRAAFNQYFEDHALGMDGRVLHEAQWRAVRERVAQFFGLSASDIGLCSCSSEAYNLAAMALRLKDGDEVIINDLDFPAGATPWLQPSCPAQVKVWRHREGRLLLDDLVPLLGPRTRLVNISLVSFYNGFRLQVPEVAEVVRRSSPALLSVDVTQALGRIPLDLRGADLIISSTHKWIMACHGGGLVGVPPERAGEWTVPAGGWFHLHDAFGPNRFEGVQTLPGAASFMVGMPNYPAWYAIRAALDYLAAITVEAIDEQTRPVMELLLSQLQRLPVQLITPPTPSEYAGIVAFLHPEVERIRDQLRQQNIHVMAHAGRLRVAVHGYNTSSDIHTFLAALRAVLSA